jgi:hypothetical protein
MNSSIRVLATMGLLTATAAFSPRSDAEVMQAYGGNPYLGGVDVRIQVPGEKERQDSGTGSAHFAKTDDGQTRLVVSGSIRKDSDTGFVMNGIASKSGWSSRDGSLTIGKDGKITGGDVQHPYRFRFDGFVSREKFSLKIEQEWLEASKNKRGFPLGTKFVFTYDLGREPKQQAGGTVRSGQKAAGDRPCKRIVWKVRNIANLGGGPMIMTQVPVCVER